MQCGVTFSSIHHKIPQHHTRLTHIRHTQHAHTHIYTLLLLNSTYHTRNTTPKRHMFLLRCRSGLSRAASRSRYCSLNRRWSEHEKTSLSLLFCWSRDRTGEHFWSRIHRRFDGQSPHLGGDWISRKRCVLWSFVPSTRSLTTSWLPLVQELPCAYGLLKKNQKYFKVVNCQWKINTYRAPR
jgi:hypothetical protein